MHFDVKFSMSAQRFEPIFNSGGQAIPVEFQDLHTVTTAPDVEIYDGAYVVTPKADVAQTLPTAQRYLLQDVNVKKIPYYEVDNAAGGSTIYIGADDEIIIE